MDLFTGPRKNRMHKIEVGAGGLTGGAGGLTGGKKRVTKSRKVGRVSRLAGSALTGGRIMIKFNHPIHGKGFFTNIWDGIKTVPGTLKKVFNVVKPALSVVKPLLGFAGPYGAAGAAALGALGAGKPRRKVAASDGRAKRGAIVKSVMAKHPNFTLGQASAFVKAKGLY